MGPNLTRPASYRRIKAPCERDLEFWSGVAMFGRLFFSLCISFIDTQHLGEWFRTNLSHSFSLARSKIPNNGIPVSKMGSSDLPCGSPNIKCFFLSSTPKNPLFGSSKLFFVWYQVNQSVGSYMDGQHRSQWGDDWINSVPEEKQWSLKSLHLRVGGFLWDTL